MSIINITDDGGRLSKLGSVKAAYAIPGKSPDAPVPDDQEDIIPL
jgi:hypothetical protein